MSEIQVFNNPEFGEIRTMEMNGEPYFVGREIAEKLGYAKPENALAAHVDDEDKTTTLIQGDGSNYKSKTTIINESGLYSLVLSSKLPGAKRFKRWVTSEVLPSIRRNGGYIDGQETMSAEELMAKALVVAQQTLAAREARISQLTVQNTIMLPKAEYFDQLVERNTLTNFRETAKELNIPPRQFVQFLLDKKYLYRDKKGKLLPFENRNDGLFEVKECVNEKTQWSGTQTLITPRGRETFRLLCV
nr:MAG TPA: repressor domain protein [Caudoviricetes sp.]